MRLSSYIRFTRYNLGICRIVVNYFKVNSMLIGQSSQDPSSIEKGDIVIAMFQGILGREIGEDDRNHYIRHLNTPEDLSTMLSDLVASHEFKSRCNDLAVSLPDLTQLYPERYERNPDGNLIFHAKDDSGIQLMDNLIHQHRYYDSFPIWRPEIDTDKRVTAAIVESLGVGSCIELGCFSGSVLSIIKKRGLGVKGVEVSHRAFLLAHPDIYNDIIYGSFPDVPIQGLFGCFLAMDVLEHISPLLIDKYVSRISSLLEPGGFAFINSPMFGKDDVFGSRFLPYVDEWIVAGDSRYWFDMHCDTLGWPMHGHLIWASPVWWERLFAKHGFARNRSVERSLHRLIDTYYDTASPARSSFFVLQRTGDGYCSFDFGRAQLLIESALTDQG